MDSTKNNSVLQNTQIGPGSFVTPAPVINTTLGATATTPSVAPVAPTSSTISSASLAPVVPVQLPTPTPTVTTPPVTTNAADAILKASEVEDTKIQKDAKSLSEQIASITGNLTGQAQALATEQNNAGLPKLKQELQSINSEILKKQAEMAQDDINLIANSRAEERRDTLLPFAQMGQAKLAGDAAILRALKSSEIGVLNATALAKQGDIALAQETAKQAVDLKYAPYREAIDVYKAQLEALQPLLTADEKKQARAQDIKANLAIKEIEKQERNEKDIQEMLIDATAQQAPESILNNAKRIADAGGTPIDVARAIGQYSGPAAKAQLLKEQLNTEKLQQAKIVKDINSVGDGKPPTEGQSASAIYASRIVSANKTLDKLTPTLQKMNYAQFKAVASNNALVNKTLSPELQQAGQAMNNFVTAVLRKESGASISPTEFETARAQYFPQYGDSPAVILQKKQTREIVQNGLIKASGNAYEATIEEQAPNPFATAIGADKPKIPGTSILSTDTNGGFSFIIPTTKK